MKGKTTAQRARLNIEFLIRRSGLEIQEVARRAGMSLRGLNYIRSGERSPNVDTLDDIGQVFGLTGWHLISPDLERNIENQEWLDRLKEAFVLANPDGQELLKSAARAAEKMRPAREG